MVTSSRSTTPRSASTPAACPFCGQPLLNKQAIEHLTRQSAAYETRLRKELEAQSEARVQVRIREVETCLKADASKKLKAAVRERAEEVTQLKSALREAQKTQDARVKAEVRKKLAEAEAAEQERLSVEFAKREKQLQLTVEKLRDQNAELARRVERLSAGDRGEFNEDEILARLTRAFPDDDLTRTRRGQRGADIFQRVRFRTDGDLVEAGLIIYECKDTLQWNNSFITQMKSEAKLHKTDYAVLISRCLPRGEKTLAVIEGVVIVEPARAIAIAEVMRRMVIETYRSGALAGARVEKTAELFYFVSSTEFRQAFDSLAEASDALHASLARERQSHQRVWTERDRLYQEIEDKIVQIDARFKAILEAKGTEKTLRSLRPTA